MSDSKTTVSALTEPDVQPAIDYPPHTCFGDKWDGTKCGKPATRWMHYIKDDAMDDYEGEWFCDDCARFHLRRSTEHNKR